MNSVWWRVVKAGLVFGAILTVYLWNLGTPALWGDEADTAVFSRNVLRFGHPVADDSRNLMVTENCNQVSHSLLSRRIPWMQYYAGAASLFFFGNGTLGIRTGFVLIGACCFFPLAACLRPFSRFPNGLAALALLIPQVVLFHRSARYYSVLSILFILLIWLYQKHDMGSTTKKALVFVVFILLYHTHYIAALCSTGAILIYCLLYDRKALPLYSLAGATGFAFILAFLLLLPGIGSTEATQIMLFSEPVEKISTIVWEGLVSGILDLDFINSFPLILFFALVLAGCFSSVVRAAVKKTVAPPLLGISLICTALNLLANALLIGYETPCRFSVLRYMPHCIMGISLFLPLLFENLGGVFSFGWRRQVFIMGSILAAAVLNLGTLSYWINPMPCRDSQISWWAPVFSEIIEPPEDPVEKIVRSLACSPGENSQHTLAIWPPYQNEVFIFYCGEAYLIIPEITPESECEKAIIDKIGLERYRLFDQAPEKMILFQNRLKSKPVGYDFVAYPFYRKTSDAIRPELTRHGFAADSGDPHSFIAVYSRKNSE